MTFWSWRAGINFLKGSLRMLLIDFCTKCMLSSHNNASKMSDLSYIFVVESSF